MLANFAQELSGKEPGKHWAGRWLKAHGDQLISQYTKGLDCQQKRADSHLNIHYTLNFWHRRFKNIVSGQNFSIIWMRKGL